MSAWWAWLGLSGQLWAIGGFGVFVVVVVALALSAAASQEMPDPPHSHRARRGQRKPEPEPPAVTEAEGRDFYGSIDRTAELALHHDRLPGQAARKQMLADLSPEALEAWGPRGPSESYGAWLAEGADDPGPGGLSSLTSGPDQAPTGGDAQGWAGGCAPVESRPAARADLTGSLSPRHHEEDPGWLAHGQPGLTRLADTGDIAAAHHAHPGPDYDDGELGTGPFVDAWQQRKRKEQERMTAMIVWPGPDTGRLDWLDQQLAAHLEWARRVRGQVTGWGLEAAA